MMKHTTAALLAVAATGAVFAIPASGGLFIYEPFDYTPTSPINNGAWLGDGNQAGGTGLGTWSQLDNGSTTVDNEADVRDGGLAFTDSFSNILPAAGNAWTRVQRVGQIATSSPVDPSATSALTADNSTIWMTFLFQDLGFSGPDFGIGLASEPMIGNDSQSLTAAGYGVGLGMTSGPDTSATGYIPIHTAVYNNSANFTRVNEANPSAFTVNGASGIHLLAMKVNWKPFGTPDEIYVFDLTGNNMALEPDESTALASDTFDFTLAQQQSLDFFSISDTQVANVDEVRIATSYLEAVGIPEPGVVALLGLGALSLVIRRRPRE